MEKTNTNNKLNMKDIITLSIFNVAILIIMVAVKMVITIVATPAFNYLAYVGVMALFIGPLFVVMSNKVAKPGTYFITALFSGLMMLAFGAAWFLIVEIGTGIICEIIMRGKGNYKNSVLNCIGYLSYWLLYAWGSAIPMFMFKDQYLKSLEGAYSKEGINTLVRFYGSIDMLLIIGLITVVLALIGFWIGNLFLKKHVKKANLA